MSAFLTKYFCLYILLIKYSEINGFTNSTAGLIELLNLTTSPQIYFYESLNATYITTTSLSNNLSNPINGSSNYRSKQRPTGIILL